MNIFIPKSGKFTSLIIYAIRVHLFLYQRGKSDKSGKGVVKQSYLPLFLRQKKSHGVSSRQTMRGKITHE